MFRLPKVAVIATLLVACAGLMSPNWADARGGGGGGGGRGGGGGGFRGGGGGFGGGFGGYRGGGFGGGYRGFSSGGFGGYSRGGMGTATSGFRGTGGLNQSGFSRGGFNRGMGHVPTAPVTSRMHNGMGGRNGYGRGGYGNRGYYGYGRGLFGFWGPYWGLGFGPWWWWGGGLGYGLYGGYGGGGYYNPYYTDNYLSGGFDYGQPLPETAQTSEDDASFTQARADFYAGDYRKSLLDIQPALQEMSGSLDVHEFHALIYFALGNYYQAAAVAHTVLEAGPGWNWETLQSFYSSPEVYTQQLRALEHFVGEHPKDAGAQFLLGYQYAMLGHLNTASHQFASVVSLEPRDKLSAAILANLDRALKAKPQTPSTAPSQPETPSVPSQTPPPPEFPMESDGAANAPGAATNAPNAQAQTGASAPAANALVGTWQANPFPGFTIEATLQPDGHFVWKASQGEHSESFSGTYAVDGKNLVLTRTDGQKMDGILTMKGANGFNFHSKTTPQEDPGLNFAK